MELNSDPAPRVVTFGEIMSRLSPPGFNRLRQSLPGTLEATFAGAEANVAASLAVLGVDAAFVSCLPRHALADACVGALRSVGVDTRHVLRSDIGRLGLYFVETGANQRPSQVIYDRDFSSIGLTPASAYDWSTILGGADWLHVSGITPAVSATAAAATKAAVEVARQAGVCVSCDLNFRNKLWRWREAASPRELAEETMRGILPSVDVVIGNEEDCSDVLGIRAGDTDVHRGKLEIDRYPEVAKELVRQFPNVGKVAITLRESLSASHNRWGAVLYEASSTKAFFAPMANEVYEPYEIRNIVDRVGGGDSFSAGLIYALNSNELSNPQHAVSFAAAASCLAHSIPGDFNYSSRKEIESLMGGSASGRVVR